MTTANRSLVSSSSSSSSHVEPNRLLKASKQGKVEEVRQLLKLGESVKQRDCKGNTALHCASKRGHYAVVQLLVQNGAPVELLNDSGRSPMELSTQPGITKLLALAVQKKEAPSSLVSKKQILLDSMKSSSSSSYPLHLAAKEGNSKELLRLLELGRKVDERDKQGNTPLHLASMHGRLSTVKLLVEKGASVQVRKASKETPLDLAKCWGQSEVVSFLLKKHEQSVSSSPKVTLIQNNNVSTTAPSKDPEGQAYLQFEAAYEAGKAMDQVLSLEKLAELRLDKKDYFGAAHLINGAIAVATQSQVEQGRVKLLYQKLMEIEQLFLTKELGLKAAKRSRPTYARNELKKIREGAARRLQQNKPIQEVQGFLTKGYKVLLCELIGECIGLLGKGRPKGFAVIGLGSMARGEMCPYSDVEFAFIVRDPTQQNLAYFRRLSQLLTLKMINLGETKHELIRPKRVNQVMQPAKSLTPTGFSMDIGGLCPEGKKGIYELIGSPRQLANFQMPEWLHKNESEIILVNAMTTVCPVMGDESLITDYKKRIESILNKREGVLSLTGSRLRERRAIQLMRGYVSEFKPRLDQDKIELRGFDVKQELYRLFQTVISGLSLYHGIRATSTSQRLRELVRKRVMSRQGVARLQKVFSTLLRLRVETHLFYGTEKEILYHSKVTIDKSTDDLYTITNEIQQEIIEAYKTLVPLHQRAERFVQGDKAAFANCSFCDKTVGTHDDQQRVNLNFGSALQSSQAKAALNPNDPFAQSDLGLVQSDLGRVKLAFQSAQETLILLKQQHNNKPHLSIRDSLNNLGVAYRTLGEYSKAIKYHEASLKMNRAIYGKDKEDSSVASCRGNLGSTYHSLGEYFKAIKHFEASLEMKRAIYGKDKQHSSVAASLNNLGTAYNALGEYSKAIKYHEKSLKMNGAIYNKDKAHPDVASGLNNLGEAYRVFGNPSKAIEYHDASLNMKREIYGEKERHPDVADSLNNLGNAYCSLGEYLKAIEYYKASLNMKREIYGEKERHPNIAVRLMNLGTAYHALNDYPKAIKYLEASLKMKRKIYGKDKPYPDIADSLNNLGLAYKALSQYSKAIEYHDASLKMKRAIYGKEKPHPDIAGSLNNLGLAYKALSQYSKAIKYHDASLKMKRAIYGKEKPHPDVAISLNNLASAYSALGEYSNVIELFQESLKIQRAIYIEEKVHPDIADSLNNLGAAYGALSNYPKAIEYHDASLKMKRKIYGKNKPHSAIADSLNNLGAAHDALSNYPKAIEYYEASLKVYRAIYRQNKVHSKVADSLNNLGAAYGALSNYPKAIELYKESLEMKREIYGKNKPHSAIADSLMNLGVAYSALRNYSKAIDLYEESLKMKREIYGKDKPHSDIASCLMNLGAAYSGCWDKAYKAIEYYKASLDMKREIYGKDKAHRSVAMNLYNLGSIYYRLGNVTNSFEYLLQSHSMFVQTVGVNNPQTRTVEKLLERIKGQKNQACQTSTSIDNQYFKLIKYYKASLNINSAIYVNTKAYLEVAGSLNDLGVAYDAVSNCSRSIECYEASLKMRLQIYGEKKAHPEVANSLNNLGWVLIKYDKPSEGLKCCEKALLAQQKIYKDKPNYGLACTLDSIGCAHRALDRPIKALEFFQRSYDMCMQTVGASHPTTQEVKGNLEEQKKKLNQSSSSSSSSSSSR